MSGLYIWPKLCVVSEMAKDFVRRLLETDPQLRMTATEALQHPWITVCSPIVIPAKKIVAGKPSPKVVPRLVRLATIAFVR